MSFETPDNLESSKTENGSGREKVEASREVAIECPERQEVVDQALFELKTSFETLGIEDWKLPEIKIKFVESKGEAELGRVEVHGRNIEIIYDKRFSSAEMEAELIEELRVSGKDYPGMQQTLKHELAHVAMWSITRLHRQPATRLVDEGWASLVENTSGSIPAQRSKESVKRGLKNEADLYNRCLDFGNPVIFEEDLNTAEYETGQALLLWIHEKFGSAKMVELIQKSPAPERRNDDLMEGEFDSSAVSNGIHTSAPEYIKIIEDVKLGNVSMEETVKKAKAWEGKQFETALIEVTGLQSIDEVKEEFLKWINEKEVEQENLSPEQAMQEFFLLMDGIEKKEASLENKAEMFEQIVSLLRTISEIKDPRSYKLFAGNEHFLKLNIRNKFVIQNTLDRDLHKRIIMYLESVGIEITEEEKAEIIRTFREKDAENKQDTFESYAQNGLLTLKSIIEKGLLKESSSTPGDFSSMEDLHAYSLEEHANIRGYELKAEDIRDELFYGRNSFFGVATERAGENIDRASNLPKQEVENRLRNSMIFVMKSEKAEISGRTDNDKKEDIVRRDIKPEEIDYLVVDESQIAKAQKAFGHLPCKIVSAGITEAEVKYLFEGPYKLPDYRGEVEKIVQNEGRVWCHMARLPVDTYPKE